MYKFTLKSLSLRWDSSVRGHVKVPKSFGFNISSTSYVGHYDSGAVQKLKAGDEVIVNYSSSDCFRGWFIGVGKTTKFVCIIWLPHRDLFQIVDVKTNPVRADWTSHMNSQGISLIAEKIEKYTDDPEKDFELDIVNEEIHYLS